MNTIDKSRIFNLPNSLSIARIGVAPVLVVMLLSPGELLSVASSALFGLVCITDWLDGYYARKRGTVTTLGKFLDPLADKLLITTALIMLIPLGRVPAWMVALMIGREIAVTGLRSVAAADGVIMPAGKSGKIKTVLQISAIIPLLLHYRFYGVDFQAIGMVILWAALLLTLWSGVEYFAAFFGKGRKSA